MTMRGPVDHLGPGVGSTGQDDAQPQTPSGRRVLWATDLWLGPSAHDQRRADIIAIEAEAATAERDRIAAAPVPGAVRDLIDAAVAAERRRTRWHHDPDAPPEHFCEDCDALRAGGIRALAVEIAREWNGMAADRLVERQRHAHPEAYCHRCGGWNLGGWHAPSPIWNAVMRRNGGPEPFDGIICPQCFEQLAEQFGVIDERTGWHVHPDPFPDVPMTSPDGRVWDPTQCLWVDPHDEADEEAERRFTAGRIGKGLE